MEVTCVLGEVEFTEGGFGEVGGDFHVSHLLGLHFSELERGSEWCVCEGCVFSDIVGLKLKIIMWPSTGLSVKFTFSGVISSMVTSPSGSGSPWPLSSDGSFDIVKREAV